MELFLSLEAQRCTENGLASIMSETKTKLSFVTNSDLNLLDTDNYGTEFRLICIIPSCMDDEFWRILGWKERRQIWRKKKEADIRLRMDYERFINASLENKYLLYYDIIIKSIKVIQERSKGDFRGDALIKDIMYALRISSDDIDRLNRI